MTESKMEFINGQTYIVLGTDAQKDIDTILTLSKEIHSNALTEEQCQIMLDTIIDMQFSYSDDISEFEDVLRAVVDFFEIFKCRLSENNENTYGQEEPSIYDLLIKEREKNENE